MSYDKSAAKIPNVAVLVLSARDAVADKVGNLELGADDYLTKPFALAELLVRVKALLRRGPVNRASIIRIADLELDRLSQQVKRDGCRIELTGKSIRCSSTSWQTRVASSPAA